MNMWNIVLAKEIKKQDIFRKKRYFTKIKTLSNKKIVAHMSNRIWEKILEKERKGDRRQGMLEESTQNGDRNKHIIIQLMAKPFWWNPPVKESISYYKFF
ncbi:hypothetical protein J7I91_06015 [Pseudomonas sp. ISL-84]|nr:hypothetical protein [Pseudomonas sp. ISL-84]